MTHSQVKIQSNQGVFRGFLRDKGEKMGAAFNITQAYHLLLPYMTRKTFIMVNEYRTISNFPH